MLQLWNKSIYRYTGIKQGSADILKKDELKMAIDMCSREEGFDFFHFSTHNFYFYLGFIIMYSGTLNSKRAVCAQNTQIREGQSGRVGGQMHFSNSFDIHFSNMYWYRDAK